MKFFNFFRIKSADKVNKDNSEKIIKTDIL